MAIKQQLDKRVSWIVIAAAITLLVFSVFISFKLGFELLSTNQTSYRYSEDRSIVEWNEVGDAVGGIAGTIASIATVLLLIYTIILLQGQNKLVSEQNTANTLAMKMSTYQNLVMDFEYNGSSNSGSKESKKDWDGREALREWLKDFEKSISNDLSGWKDNPLRETFPRHIPATLSSIVLFIKNNFPETEEYRTHYYELKSALSKNERKLLMIYLFDAVHKDELVSNDPNHKCKLASIDPSLKLILTEALGNHSQGTKIKRILRKDIFNSHDKDSYEEMYSELVSFVNCCFSEPTKNKNKKIK